MNQTKRINNQDMAIRAHKLRGKVGTVQKFKVEVGLGLYKSKLYRNSLLNKV
jgi:hypothetical protein